MVSPKQTVRWGKPRSFGQTGSWYIGFPCGAAVCVPAPSTSLCEEGTWGHHIFCIYLYSVQLKPVWLKDTKTEKHHDSGQLETETAHPGEQDPRARHGLSKGRGVTVLIPGTVLVSQAKGGQRVWGSASKSHSFSCGLLASPAPLNHNLPSLEPQSEKSALRRGTDLSHKPGEFPGLSTHGLFSHKPRRLVALKEPEHFLPIL